MAKAKQPEKGAKPSYILRAKQSPDSEYFVTVGAAWPFKEGNGFVLKMQALPVNWDGDLLMVEPKEE